MKRSLHLSLRAVSGVNSTGRNTKVEPKIPLMAAPHEVDITKYSDLFKQYHTIPHVWEQKTLTDAWSAVYRELHAVQNALRNNGGGQPANGTASNNSSGFLDAETVHQLTTKQNFIKTYDVNGLSRLSSNLEISRILLLLPEKVREAISKNPQFKLGQLEEIFIHVGMPVEVRGDGFTFAVEVASESFVEEEIVTSTPMLEAPTSVSSSTNDTSDPASNPADSNNTAANNDDDGYVARVATQKQFITRTIVKHHHLIASREDIVHIEQRIAPFGTDGRSTLPGTLHRISAYRGKNGKDVVGFTIRVGKYVANAGRALVSTIARGNLLILSRPSVGKTTLLRDLAVQASLLPNHPRVVVIDTSCEIGGDNITPLPFMNRVRRILVKERKLQSEAMLDALQNHSPDYIIVDEIANQQEAEAAYTISQRGVKIIATCHAENLQTLLQNKQLNTLVGGVSQAFLSNEERRMKNKTKKSILERPLSSPFKYVLEVPSRSQGILYTDVNEAVDRILDDGDVTRDLVRSRFGLRIDEELPPAIDAIVKSGTFIGKPNTNVVAVANNNNNQRNHHHHKNNTNNRVQFAEDNDHGANGGGGFDDDGDDDLLDDDDIEPSVARNHQQQQYNVKRFNTNNNNRHHNNGNNNNKFNNNNNQNNNNNKKKWLESDDFI